MKLTYLQLLCMGLLGVWAAGESCKTIITMYYGLAGCISVLHPRVSMLPMLSTNEPGNFSSLGSNDEIQPQINADQVMVS